MYLRIEQDNTAVEEVNSYVITKLYDLSIGGNISNTSDLKGRLHTTATYGDYITHLTTTYPDLYINANNVYVSFQDKNVENVLAAQIGDGTGVTEAQMLARTAYIGFFRSNNLIVSFNELYKFQNVTQTSTESWDFRGCTELQEIDLRNFTYIGKNVFRSDSKLRTVGNTTNLLKVDDDAFGGCSSLQTINLSSCTEIGIGAFDSCSSLSNLDLSNIRKFGAGCFKNCTSLGINQDLEITTTQTDIGSNAFQGTKYRSVVVHGSSLNKIGGYPGAGVYGTFSYMSSCVKQDFSDTVITKAEGLSGGMTSLTTIIYPSTITTVNMMNYRESGAGNNITTVVILATTVPTIESYSDYWSFYGLPNLNFYVPDASLNDYKTATTWSEFASRIHGLSELSSDVTWATKT